MAALAKQHWLRDLAAGRERGYPLGGSSASTSTVSMMWCAASGTVDASPVGHRRLPYLLDFPKETS
jgi:hypothetical protein